MTAHEDAIYLFRYLVETAGGTYQSEAYEPVVDAVAAEARAATVERIRRNLLLSEGAPIPEEYAVRILDEEAARG